MRQAEPRFTELVKEFIHGEFAQSERKCITQTQSDKQGQYMEFSTIPNRCGNHGEESDDTNENGSGTLDRTRPGISHKARTAKSDELQSRHTDHETRDVRGKQNAQVPCDTREQAGGCSCECYHSKQQREPPGPD